MRKFYSSLQQSRKLSWLRSMQGLMSYFVDFVEEFRASELGSEVTAEGRDSDWSVRNASSDYSTY